MRLSTTSRPSPDPTRRAAVVALAVTAGLVLSACGGDDGTSAPDRAGDATVSIEQSRFVPDELTVAPGTTVEFVNTDPFAHTVTATEDGPGDFDSGNLDQDGTFEHRFAEPGTYDYFCEIHPTMRSTVVVEAG